MTAPAAPANYGICLGLRIFIPGAGDPDTRLGSLGTHAGIMQPFAACEINYQMHDWETGNCV